MADTCIIALSGQSISLYNDKDNKSYIKCCCTDGNTVSAILHQETQDTLYKEVKRKTEIGNRILSVTPVSIFSSYGIHFSDNRKLLNLEYLGKHFSANSIFHKSANLILAEKTDANTFCIDFYENKTGCSRCSISAFASVGLAACRDGLCEYNKEITVITENASVRVTCLSHNTVKAESTVIRVCDGTLNMIN